MLDPTFTYEHSKGALDIIKMFDSLAAENLNIKYAFDPVL